MSDIEESLYALDNDDFGLDNMDFIDSDTEDIKETEPSYLISLFNFKVALPTEELILPLYVTNDLSIVQSMDFNGTYEEYDKGIYLLPFCLRITDMKLFKKAEFIKVMIASPTDIMNLEIDDSLQYYYTYIVKMLTQV